MCRCRGSGARAGRSSRCGARGPTCSVGPWARRRSRLRARMRGPECTAARTTSFLHAGPLQRRGVRLMRGRVARSVPRVGARRDHRVRRGCVHRCRPWSRRGSRSRARGAAGGSACAPRATRGCAVAADVTRHDCVLRGGGTCPVRWRQAQGRWECRRCCGRGLSVAGVAGVCAVRQPSGALAQCGG